MLPFDCCGFSSRVLNVEEERRNSGPLVTVLFVLRQVFLIVSTSSGLCTPFDDSGPRTVWFPSRWRYYGINAPPELTSGVPRRPPLVMSRGGRLSHCRNFLSPLVCAWGGSPFCSTPDSSLGLCARSCTTYTLIKTLVVRLL